MVTRLIPLFCLLLVAGGQGQILMGAPSSGSKTIDVSVLYRERLRLPPGAELTVTLSDVSKTDVPESVISSLSQPITTGPPYPVSLTYSEEKIVTGHRYNLKARIEQEGQLMFISTYAIDPFASEKRPIEIIMHMVANNPAQPPIASLKNTHWRLLVAKGTAIGVAEGQKEPFLYLAPDEDRIRGFAGCNIFTGSFELQGDRLSFTQVAATMKMCIRDMEKEQLFLAVMLEAASYRISGDTLHLFDDGNKQIASFKAVYFQ